MTLTPMERVVSGLKDEARSLLPMDGETDFNPADWSGHNYDDAFQLGELVGRTELAREILTLLGETWQ